MPSLEFDDVLLVPQFSTVYSRQDVLLANELTDVGWIALPFISAPMSTVTEGKMAHAMYAAGGMGIIHRYNSIEARCEMVRSSGDAGAAVGLENYIEESEALLDAGAALILVDTANGHNQRTVDAVARLRKSTTAHIMAGNVSTKDGFRRLVDAGADSIRVGIGGGAACTTRAVTGHGGSTLQAVFDCVGLGAQVIADGGIRNSGDIVKALAAGADFVMLGSLLAGADEAPGRHFSNGEKMFSGMASLEAQQARGKVSVIEGRSYTVPLSGPVADTVKSLADGVRSGLSYSGAHNLKELRAQAEWSEV